ncbi:uncharacterized protein LOC131060478 [Cryptomeria japonica]|uniref:uncharacterized protein LOC131060478 n=1 Tax=Cryptomeria japonica TaxID=3369 RepID=UPI0027D9E254|nr:uncharacterized protein LOC131060478 [Cryptomeria japonica]
MCVSCSRIYSGIDDAAGADGSSSHLYTICGSRCQARTTEDFALTDELMDMVFAHERQTQDAAVVSHTPPLVTIAATSMPKVLTGDQMSQIDEITLSAIDFGLQGYTGTPSSSRARPKKKNSSKMPKRGKKRPLSYVDLLNAPDSPVDQERAEEISIHISSMANPPPCTGEASQNPVIATVSPSMVSHPQSIGEASQAQIPSRYGHNVDPFKYVFKKTPKSDKER